MTPVRHGPLPASAAPTTQAPGAIGGLTEQILAEGALGLSAGGRRLGSLRAGRPVHPSTLARWATTGVTLSDGTRLRLEAIRVNGRLLTSWPALVRFIDAQQDPVVCPPPVRSPAARQRSSDRAAAALEAAGA